MPEVISGKSGRRLVSTGTKYYVADIKDADTVAVVHGEAFRDIRPATTIVKNEFVDPKILVEIEAEAVLDPGK